MPDASQTVEIINKKGLHARASSKFARLATTFSSHVTVSHEGETAIGIHIMDLLMLAAHKGCQIKISATGEDASAAVKALSALVLEGFGELSSE
jgi:phosphocarrier protein